MATHSSFHTLPCFCYGSLRSPPVLKMLFGQTQFASSPAFLPHFKCIYLKDKMYPGIISHPLSNTPGIILKRKGYTGVFKEDLHILDHFEGVEENAYIRQLVWIHNQITHQKQQAWVYGLGESLKANVTDREWHFEKVDEWVQNQGGWTLFFEE